MGGGGRGWMRPWAESAKRRIYRVVGTPNCLMILTEMLLLMCLAAAGGRVKETVQIALRYVGARGEGEREAPPK